VTVARPRAVLAAVGFLTLLVFVVTSVDPGLRGPGLMVPLTFSTGLALGGIVLAKRSRGPRWVVVLLASIAGIGGAIVGLIVGVLVFFAVWKPHK
jgi:hypothetical protein